MSESTRKIRKAVIPAAGFGTRLFPASKALKKELFPIVDRDGRCKPVILAIVEEALGAGIEEVCLIVQEGDQPVFENFFCSPPKPENLDKLSSDSRDYLEYLRDIGGKISFAIQKTQDGFGHAVFCARDWVGGEPFLLMLGDHLCRSNTDLSCAEQLLRVYEKTAESVVGLRVTPADRVHLYGCAAGEWADDGSVLSITEFIEKPSAEDARRRLVVEGVEEDHFLTIFGQYILEPQIFDYLGDNITRDLRERGEFQLTSCLDRLRRENGCSGYIIDGTRYDVGVPDAYRQAVMEFGGSYVALLPPRR